MSTNENVMGKDFKQQLNDLKDLTKVNVPIDLDKDGYIDRECPNQACLFEFKVLGQDWKDHVREDQVFCPLCRHEAPAQSWFTTDQIERGKEEAIKYIHHQVGGVLRQMVKEFNDRQPNNGWFKLKMGFKGQDGTCTLLPLESKEAMELKIACSNCGVHYAVIGSAFFCPGCGHNSAEEMFDNAVKKIQCKTDIGAIRQALTESLGKDEAEVTCRSLVETALSDCVVAFQRFCEVTFSRIAPGANLRQNVFQRLDDGEALWRNQVGQGYSDWITPTELLDLKRFFQRRHLLAHTDGIVDSRYVASAGDGYQVGQRIVVKPDDVHQCLNMIIKLVNKIKQFL